MFLPQFYIFSSVEDNFKQYLNHHVGRCIVYIYVNISLAGEAALGEIPMNTFSQIPCGLETLS